jgi:hypothetical protein
LPRAVRFGVRRWVFASSACNIGYAAANQRGLATTEHWDEERSPDVAFCFKVWEAAFAFMAYCAKTGIPFRKG